MVKTNTELFKQDAVRLGETGGKNDPYDKAMTKSSLSTLRVECVELQRFATHREARIAVFEYIRVFYKRQRLHSALGYCSPLILRPLTYAESLPRPTLHKSGSPIVLVMCAVRRFSLCQASRRFHRSSPGNTDLYKETQTTPRQLPTAAPSTGASTS